MKYNSANHHSLYQKSNRLKDTVLKYLIYCATLFTISVLLGLVLYILINGVPHLSIDFLLKKYSETNNSMNGILPMIINTIYIVLITLIIAVPIGVSSAIYLTQYAANGFFVKAIRFAAEILSGIPSIIFGLFGYTVFCIFLGLGTSIISGCLTMFICILPIIIRTTEEALLSVPKSYTEGALALGAGKLRIIFGIILPCASPGILTAIILASGRIIGESAALIYTSGMSYKLSGNVFSHIMSGGRTLTLHLYQLSKQANSDNAFGTAFATASVLLIIVLILNISSSWISRKISGINKE